MTNVTTTIPYGKLILSDINVRKRIPERHIAAIAAPIAEHGLIHPLIVSPATPRKTKYAVHAGGLRWRAIGQLIEAGTLPKGHAVEVKIYGDESAAMREISLIENLIRENMSPAEECTAYRDIVADGASVEDVARRFSVTVRHVNGRLRLADLAPPIFAALSDDEITLDVAAAYGSTSDHTRQLAVWESVSGTWQANNPDAIRRGIAAASIEGDDLIVLLAGEADYIGAGGRIERDLFASAGEGRWVGLARGGGTDRRDRREAGRARSGERGGHRSGRRVRGASCGKPSTNPVRGLPGGDGRADDPMRDAACPALRGPAGTARAPSAGSRGVCACRRQRVVLHRRA